MMFGRPRMCSPETQWSIARWVKDHPQFPCYSDAMLAASQGSGGLLNGMRQNRSFEPDAIRYRMVLHQLKADFALWDSTWFGEHSEWFHIHVSRGELMRPTSQHRRRFIQRRWSSFDTMHCCAILSLQNSNACSLQLSIPDMV